MDLEKELEKLEGDLEEARKEKEYTPLTKRQNEQTIIFEEDNGAWLPRNYLPSLDKGMGFQGGIFGGSLKLTNYNIFFTGRDNIQNVAIPLRSISSFNEVEIAGLGRYLKDKEGGILIRQKHSTTIFKVGDQEKWIEELMKVWNPTEFALEKKAKDLEVSAKKIIDYTECIKIWEEIGRPNEAMRIKKLVQDKIDSAKYQERLLEFDEAANIYKKLGMDDDTIRVRKLKAEQGAVKIAQKVVQGDEITKTEIKDSVVSKSNIGAGGKSKAEEIKEIKELLDSGAIDDDEFKQMKKEILG
jgi:hypothetical protein